MLNEVNTTDKKYAPAVFLDIIGVFDNAWWPRILVHPHDFGVKGKE